MIRADIVDTPEKVIELKKVWKDIFISSSHEPSTSYEWTNALLLNHVRENDKFRLIIFRDNRDILGFIPLIITEESNYGLKLSTVFPIAEQYNTHSDFLLRKYSDDVTRAFLNRLFNLGVRWDIFRIKRFLEQNPILSSFERILSEIKLPYEIREEEPSFFLKLDKTYDLYLNKRTGKFRNYLKRIERKIGEAGQYYFCQVEINGNIHDAYTQLLLIEKNSWKHIHGTAISSIRRQKEFYEKLCTGFHKTGLLHLEFMYFNDNPIAYNLGVIKDNIYFYLKTSFDERYRKHSPSTLLRAHLIKKLIKDKIKILDFPGEPYEWERQWTEDLRWHKSLLIYNRTLNARIYRTYKKIKNMKKKLNNKRCINFHNPKDLKAPKRST
jgi:CelD/BcsL family acetyltransferase involved in cellulose biosynthesis